MGVAPFPMDDLDAHLGVPSWIAFFYIGWRARRVRWLLWGLLYFAAFVAFAAIATFGTESPGSRMGRCHRANGSGGHSLCGSRLCGSRRLPGASGESDARSRSKQTRGHSAASKPSTKREPVRHPFEEPKPTTPSASSENDSAPSKPEVEREEVTAPERRNADRRIRRGQRGLWPKR